MEVFEEIRISGRYIPGKPRGIKALLYPVRNALVFLTMPRLQKALVKFQEAAEADELMTKRFYVESDTDESRVSVTRTKANLRECLSEFSRISGKPVESLERYSDKWLYIHDLYVPEELRHIGIGSLLLDKVDCYASQPGMESDMVLTLMKPDAGLHEFYIKNGFRQISPTIYYKPWGTLEMEEWL